MSAEIETLHRPFQKFLLDIGQPFTYHRPDRATGATLGDADFMLFKDGRVLFIEFKAKAGVISAAQKARHAELAASGCTVHVIRDLESAVRLVGAWQGHRSIDAEVRRQREDLRLHGNTVWIKTATGFNRLRDATADDMFLPKL